jgi:hypothetical protein
MGQVDRAAMLATWIQVNALDDEGDLTGRYARPPLHQHFYSWANSWVICGTQCLGQFAISVPALDFLLTLQHPDTGGFLTAGPEAGLNDHQDVLSSAAAGLACLYGGQLAAAEAAGRFLLWMWENQPGGAAARLYFMAHQADEIIAEFDEDDAEYYAVNSNRPGQWYHIPALAAGFLFLLHEATGEATYLQGGHDYLRFADGCAADRYRSEKSMFLGWAAAVAFKATANANYQRIVEDVAGYMLSQQLDNGSWLKGAMGSDITADVVDATAEGIICLAKVIESVAVTV